MSSCEPSRSSAYSEDMRWRIVWQSYGLGVSNKEIASNLNIGVSTVRRIISMDIHHYSRRMQKTLPFRSGLQKNK